VGDFERRVLRLVADGKLTPDEGEELLRSHERGTLRDLRNMVEEGFSGVQRVVRDRTEERTEELLSAELSASQEPLELKAIGDFVLAVRRGEAGVCRVVWRVRNLFGEAPTPPRVTLEGRMLRVEGREHGGFSVGAPFWATGLDIYLPPETRVAGAILQRLGRVELLELPLAELRIDAQNGQVRVRTPSLDDVAIASRNGSITLEADAGERVRVEAWNGRIGVRGALHDVEVTTRNGRIDADLQAVHGGRCSLHTLNGPVELTLPAGVACELRAETVHGPIIADMEGMTVTEDVRDLTRRRLCSSTRGELGELSAELGSTNGAVRVTQRAR